MSATLPGSRRINAILLQQARALAESEGGSVLSALERLANLDGPAFLSELGRAFAYDVIDMDGLRGMQAAFELLPFNLALERDCVACRDADERLWFVFADPLNPDLLEWAERQLYLLSARTLQNLLFVMVAPPLLLLGTPRWLLRRLLRGRLAFRAARWVTRPLLPLLLYNAVLIGVHLPPAINVAGGSQLLTFLLDMLVIASGLVFWWPALARLPELQPMGYPGRIGSLLLSVFVPTVPAVFYTYARYPIYQLYELAPRVSNIPAVADQQVAGVMMKSLGGVILFAVMSVMFFRWHRVENARGRVQRAE